MKLFTLFLASLLPSLGLPAQTLVFDERAAQVTGAPDGFPALQHMVTAWGDVDRDGDLDVIISGGSPAGPVTRLYRNQGNFQFAEITVHPALPQVQDGALAWGDIDNDGDLDLALTGSLTASPTVSDLVAGVYRNEGGAGVPTGDMAFPLAVQLPGSRFGSLAWGDIDNDGDQDLCMSGDENAVGVPPEDRVLRTRVYRSNGVIFGLDPQVLRDTDHYADICARRAQWTDLNGDGFLDLILLQMQVYRLTSSELDNSGVHVFINSVFPPGTLNPHSHELFNDGFFDDPVLQSGSWLSPTVLPNPWAHPAIKNAVGDWDGNGRDDFYLTSFAHHSLLMNDGFDDPFIEEDLPGFREVRVRGGEFLDFDICAVANIVAADFMNYGTPQALLVSMPFYGDSLQEEEYLHPPIPLLLRDNEEGGMEVTPPTSVDLGIEPLFGGALDAVDLNGDLSVDLFMAGWDNALGLTVRTYENLRPANHRPSPPTVLTAVERTPRLITIEWSGAGDDESPATALRYSVEIYRVADGQVLHRGPVTPGGVGLLPGQQGAISGDRFSYIPPDGAVLPDGEYSVVIRAVDPGGCWSLNSPFHNFTIRAIPTPPSEPDMTPFYYPAIGLPGRTSVLAAGDIDNDGDFDVVQAGRDLTPSFEARDTVISFNQGTDPTNVTQHLFAHAQTLPEVTDAAAAWGDMDADGFLDLAIAGAGPDGYMARIYRNLGNGSFQSRNAFDGLRHASLDWGDYDNDGDLDLVMNGFLADGKPRTRIYRNNGRTFSHQTTSINHYITEIPNLGGGAVSWIDFDQDGDLDLLQCGVEPSPHANVFTAPLRTITQLYENKGMTRYGTTNGPHWLFIPVQTNLPLIRNHSHSTNGTMRAMMRWTDLNGDGRPDLVIAGHHVQRPLAPIQEGHPSIFYCLNQGPDPTVLGGWRFAISRNLESLWERGAQSLEPGDWDNDGTPDLLMSGFYGGFPAGNVLQVLHNDGLAFNRSSYIPVVLNHTELEYVTGLAAFGRFHADGRAVGLLFNGITKWWGYDLNGLPVPNEPAWGVFRPSDNTPPVTPPTAPTGLTATASGNSVTFAWQPSTDAQTNSAALTYNLAVYNADGVSPGGMPGMADRATGLRRLNRPGNVGQRTSWTLRDLPAGNWNWAVQAIDAGYESSPFTVAAQSFTTSPSLPVQVSAPAPLSQWMNVHPNGALTAVNLLDIADAMQARMAVGERGRIFYSQARGPFMSVLSGTEEDLHAVTIDPEGLYAVGMNGVLLHSTDAFTWSPRTSGTTRTLRALVRGNGAWVAAGDGITLFSVDGLTWSPTFLPTTVFNTVLYDTVIEDLCFAEGRYVAVGYQRLSPRILTSTDGQNWADVTPAGLPEGAILTVASDGEKFVAAGGRQTYPYRSEILSSPDGLTWSLVSSQGNLQPLRKIAYSGTWWMGVTGEGARRSTNGLSWANIGGSFNGWGIAAGGPGIFTLAGQLGAITTTTNGGNLFTPETASGNGSGIRKFAMGNGSVAGITSLPTLVSSQDEGLSWGSNQIPGMFTNFNDIAYGNGRYVAVTATQSAVSTDEGRTWTHHVDNLFSYWVAYGSGPGRFVRPDFSGNLHHSVNGVNWIMVPSVSPTYFWSIAYGLANFLVTDGAGRIYRSLDGMNWTLETFQFPRANTQGPVTLSFAHDRFFATRGDGYFAYSVDTIHWTELVVPALPTGTALWHIDRFLMTTSGNGVLLESLDGLTWTLLRVPASFNIAALASTGTGLLTGGDGMNILLSPSYIATPPSGVTPPVVNSFAHVSNSNPPSFELTVTGQVGQSVVVEISDDLVTWSELYTFIMTATTETIELSDPAISTHRYFRLR